MKKANDLSRWNRAGQKSLQYIDGSAPVYLEHIKEELKSRYKGRWSALPDLIEMREEKGLSEEQAQFQRNNELLEQYYKTDSDIGWNLAKVFSQACHVLTEHLNAHANEAYLRTITQWENVRRLVELIDYNPSFSTSASTRIVLNVKENRSGVVDKGFQVKYTPVTGGAKVIYETMEDIFIDDSLNQLRPKGWDQSEESPLSADADNADRQFIFDSRFSKVSNASVININGVGKKYYDRLNLFSEPESEYFRVKDFYELNIADTMPDIELSRLQDLKTKAAFICEFKLEPSWISIIDWLLPSILSASTESLAEKLSDTIESAESLKSKIETLSLCLDNAVFIETQLSDFVENDSPDNNVSASAQIKEITENVKTSWFAARKPKVSAGQVAMVYRESKIKGSDKYFNEAEALRIGNVDKNTNAIYVLPEKNQYSWFEWKRQEARLMVAPRWQKKCWLNGLDVIRTKEPHGLSKDSFICWKVNSAWQFSKVIEADKLNIRLQLSEIPRRPRTKVSIPDENVKLYVARPITSQVMAADLIAIGMLVGVAPDIKNLNIGDSILPVNGDAPDLSQPFKMPDPNPNDKPDPSNAALIPPGKLSFGSFLFPTPMLPMDLVKIAVDLMLSLGVMIIPSTGEIVFKSLLDISIPTADQLLNLLEALSPNLEWPGLVLVPGQTDKQAKIEALEKMLDKQPPAGEPSVIFQEIMAEVEQINPLIAVQENASEIATVAKKNPRFVVTGSFNKLETGDWLVGEFKDELRALKINSIKTLSDINGCDDFAITFENDIGISLELKKLYAEFRADLEAEDAGINIKPVDEDNIELEKVPENLKVGRKVLLMADGEGPDPVLAKIENINGNFIKTKPTAKGFNKGNLIIYANVVDASHGALKPVKRLSSGPAGEQSYSLLLDVKNVSTIADPTFPRGVRADIEVVIDGMIWQQVTGLDKSNPGDSHYLVRVTEDGYLRLIFSGRRLPSGANNVSVRYRVGAGRSGNLIEGRLIKPVSPHPLVASVLQPVASVGGEDIELVDFMRENAPATLLALDRSVSLVDFENLAMNRNDIWQAKAFYHSSASSYLDLVTVVIIPAGSVDLDKTLTAVTIENKKKKILAEEFKQNIENFLTQKSVPTVSIHVTSYQPIEIKLSLKIRVDLSSFDPIPVVERIRERMLAAFTLEYRKINQAFYLSEVYQVVETTKGVSDSKCVFQGESDEHQILAENEDQVLYLSYNPDDLLIEYEAYKV